MTEDVSDWPDCASYQTSLLNLQVLNVMNDNAERGVKLSSDFLATAQSEEHCQNVMQVVALGRQKKLNIRKRKKTTKLKYLNMITTRLPLKVR